MVEGEAVPASLMGGVCDPSPKLRRVGWFLHGNANGPERSRSSAGAANLGGCLPGLGFRDNPESEESMPEASVLTVVRQEQIPFNVNYHHTP